MVFSNCYVLNSDCFVLHERNIQKFVHVCFELMNSIRKVLTCYSGSELQIKHNICSHREIDTVIIVFPVVR